MSGSSSNSSPRKRDTEPSLELDLEALKARIGMKRFRLIKLWVEDVNGPYEAAIAPYIDEQTMVLDAGSSRGDPDIPCLQRARRTVACDLDTAGLRANTLADNRVRAPIERLPFADNLFDVIICKWVVEHLSVPIQVFREFRRVLRPGGVVALLTPNKWSLFAILARLIPHRAKQVLKSSLFGGHEEDTFPTRYRANTLYTLRRTMRDAGFVEVRARVLVGMWAFFIFNRPLALVVRRLEHLQVRIPGLRVMSTHLMGVWRKPGPEHPVGGTAE